MELPELDEVMIDDIPEIFQKADGKPFNKCMKCGKELLESEEDYVIERAFRKYKDSNVTDIIFEYAFCLSCMEEFYKTYSEDSRRKIDDFLSRNCDLVGRTNKLYKAEAFKVGQWISKCAITGKNIDECEEYQIAGQFHGNFICYAYLPWMMSDEAGDAIVELLSDETLGSIDGFYDWYNDLTTGLGKILRNRRKPVPII